MHYISSKELAREWDVSISRIIRLANEGRISGARLVGKSWMFPSDSPKPADKRFKKNRQHAEKVHFRFPLYLYTPYSESEVAHDFTDDERSLYLAELLFHKGDYTNSLLALTKLAEEKKDPYVYFGAVYYLCLCEIYLGHYPHACKLYHELNIHFFKEHLHQKELEFPIHDLETYFSGNKYYLDDFSIDPEYSYPPAMWGYILLESAFSDALRSCLKNISVNVSPYQLTCQGNSSQVSILSKILLHAYSFLICYGQCLTDQGYYHLFEACRLAEENDLEHSIAFILQYIPEIFNDLLQKRNPALLQKLQTISTDQNKRFHELLNYTQKNILFQNISPGDYKYISFAINGLSYKEIASLLHLSTASISKKYAILYEKMGVHSKSELTRLAIEQFKDYDILSMELP